MSKYIGKEIEKRKKAEEKLNKKLEKQKSKKQYSYKGYTAKNVFCYPLLIALVKFNELYKKYENFFYSCNDEQLKEYLEKYLINYCIYSKAENYFWFWADRDYNFMKWNKVKNPIAKKKLRKVSYHRIKKIVEDESFTILGCTRETERNDYDNRVIEIKFYPEKN